MGSSVLPPGFKLDTAPEAELPAGFKLDAAPTQPQVAQPSFVETVLKDVGSSFTSWAENLNRGIEAMMRSSPGATEWVRDPATGHFLPRQVADPGTPLFHASDFRANAEYWKQQSQKLNTASPKLEDISSFEDAMRFGSKAVLGNTANMITAVGSGGATVLPTSIGEQYGSLQEKGVEDPGLASVVGAGVSLLEAVTPLDIANRMLGRAAAKTAGAVVPGTLGRAVAGAVRGVKTEAPTEVAQELVGMAGESYAGVGPSAGEATSRTLNAAAGGALGGAFFGGGFSAFERDASSLPPPDPQVKQILGEAPTTPATPGVTEAFPLEEPQQPSVETGVSAPGQEVVSVPTPSTTPLELSIPSPSKDFETYGDFTKDFEQTSIGSVNVWRGPKRSTVIAETQDGRFQLSTKPSATETASWTFPSFEQAAWVDSKIGELTAQQVDQIYGMPENEVVDFIYENAKPQQAVIKSLVGDPITITNVDATSRHGNQEQLTYKQIDEIRSNPRMMQLLTGLNDTVNMFKDIFKTAGVTSEVQFLFSPQGANYGYNSVGQRRIAINLSTEVLQKYPPEGFATSLVETMIHELAHDLAHNHLPEFSRAQARLTGKLLEQYEANAIKIGSFIKESYATPYLGAIHGITELVRDPTSPKRVDPRILSALRGAGGRQDKTLSSEDFLGQPDGQQLQQQPQRQVDAGGGSGNVIQPRPLVAGNGETLARPIWLGPISNAIFGPNGVATGKSVNTSLIKDIVNNPEKYGLRKEEIEAADFKNFLKNKGKMVTSDQVEAWFVKPAINQGVEPEARVFGQHLERGADELKLVEDGIDGANLQATHNDLDKFWWGSKNFSTLLQIATRNPHISQLQNFVSHLRELFAEKNTWKYEGEKVLKDWNRLGKAQMSALSNFLFEVTAESDKFKRRLTLEELQELGKKHNLGEDAQQVYHQVDSTFRAVLTALKEVEMERIKQRVGAQNVDTWMIEQGKLNAEFEKILDRNYFPYARFGNHVVLVTATKDVEYHGRKYREGNTVHMSTYSSRREMLAMEQQAKREFVVDGLHVGNRYLPDEIYTFQGFPSHLFNEVRNTLKLSEDQADLAKRFFLNLTPSQSFIQHLRKRRGIAGFSTDAQRVFAHYLSSAAGHVARAKHMEKLKSDVAELRGSAKQVYATTGQGAKRDKLGEYAQQVLDFAINPGNDFALLRGLIFANYFAFVPAQALVNVAQLPMMTFPHLMVKYGPTKSATAMAKAMKAVTGGFNLNGSIKWTNWNLDGNPSLSPKEKSALQRGIKEGFINESFAVEVASLSNGNILDSMLSNVPQLRDAVGAENVRDLARIGRDILDLGIHPFRMSEEWNRRVAFLAAYNLEMQVSGNQDKAYQEGRETIDQTMYEYAGWNRPMVTRALGQKASLLFLFKTFMQHSLWYYMYGRGRVPAVMMLAIFAGLEGLPFAEDLTELLTTALSSFTGKRIDPRKTLRQILKTLIDDPDIVMHGAARRSFGLGYLPGMPSWDLSPKIGMGRVVPGIAPVAQAVRGEIKGRDFSSRFVEEWLGVAGSVGMNAARAAVDFGPDAAKWKMQFYPAAIRNIVRTQQALDQEAYTNAQGEPLVKFDQTDPTQLVEVFGQVLGLRPTRIAREQEVLYRASQEDAFYLARREHLMAQLETALLASKKDPEAVAEARSAIKHYNETMPPPYRLGADKIIASLKSRTKNNNVRERGLPTQTRWRQIAQEWRAVYPSQ